MSRQPKSAAERSADASGDKYERNEEFDDAKTSYINAPTRGSRRVSRPVMDEAPKVRKLTDADRQRLAALKLAARGRGVDAERMAARPAIAEPPAAVREPVRRPAAPAAVEAAADATPVLAGAAGRVPHVDPARRWDAGPALPLVALTANAR